MGFMEMTWHDKQCPIYGTTHHHLTQGQIGETNRTADSSAQNSTGANKLNCSSVNMQKSKAKPKPKQNQVMSCMSCQHKNASYSETRNHQSSYI
jgi:hypothetical protein